MAKTNRLRHLKQKYDEGCGPTCVAMVAGVSEEDVIRAVFGKDYDDDGTFWWPDVRMALRKLSVRCAPQATKIRYWHNIKHLSIVGCWEHYVVYDPATRLVYDPLRDGPSLRSRLKPLSSLAIYGGCALARQPRASSVK